MTPLQTRRPSLLVICVGLIASSSTRADEPAVPLQLQVELVTKVIEYAQEPSLQATDILHIGILTKAKSVESMRFGSELKTSLDRVGAIGGRPHDQVPIEWAGPEHLVAESKLKKLLVIYLTPGLDAEMPAIATALNGVGVITVSAVDSYVPNGAILGFALVSGHPKMLFNIAQAKRQHVVFRSAVMKLMRIVQ